MQTGDPAVRDRTAYALFDDRHMLVDAGANIFGEDAIAHSDLPKTDLIAAVSKILGRFERFGGLTVEPTDEFTRQAALLWSEGDALPVEAQTKDGRW